MNNEQAVTQLRVVCQQVLAVVELLDEPDQCVEAVSQIKAVQQTLHQIASDLLAQHLTSCVAHIASQQDSDCQAVLVDIQELFRWSNRVGLVN